MKTGTLEFIAIGFVGNRFTGEILPEVRAIQEKGVVKIVDLLFVKKDAQGKVEVGDLAHYDPAASQAYQDLTGAFESMFTQQDIERMTDEMPANTSAALLLYENAWAANLKESVRRAGGALIGGGTVPSDILEREEEKVPATAEVKPREA